MTSTEKDTKTDFTINSKKQTLDTAAVSSNGDDFFRMSIDEVEKYFNTSINDGLSSSAAQEAYKRFGPNTLGEGQKVSYTKIMAHQVFNAMILVLIISMIIAFAIKDWISGGVIAFVVFLNIGVGFVQEVLAEKTMGSLKSLSSPSAHCTRNSEDVTIPAEETVPGDIVHIKMGDTVPADLRLIDSMNLETDEALLTGESLPIAKNHDAIYEDDFDVPVGDRLNMAFSSSVVSKGRATGIVVKTGLDTEVGKIARSLQGRNSIFRTVEKSDDKKPQTKDYARAFFGSLKDIIGSVLGVTGGTPLQKKLSWLAIVLFWVAVVFAIVVMGSQKMKVNKEVAVYAICVALSMIPSALIVVLTITMAIGAQVMVKRNVIVRKLDSLEVLGGIDDICSDKTGTLTQGKMIVRKAWIPNVGSFAVENSDEVFNPKSGEVQFYQYKSPLYIEDAYSNEKPIKPMTDFPNPLPQNFHDWLSTGALANIASIHKSFDEEKRQEVWKAHGDATEIAIRVFTTRFNFVKELLDAQYDHLTEFPFDSSIKRMSSIYTNPKTSETKVYTKGAVERILGCCSSWYGHTDDDEESYDTQDARPLDEEVKQFIEKQMTVLSSQGLRVLALATKDITDVNIDINNREEVEKDLVFQGLVGIYDPPRLETAGSVKLCHQAGINVRMLTGDHLLTAKAIAQEVGIIPRNLYHYGEDVVKVMTMAASDFDKLSDQEIDNLPVLPLVIARCAPQTKVRMIDALHRRKKFAAMTGDGVNDSPSLKKADVGVAMGMNGSDVAKEASDIVLTDDNFASILNAVEEGRRMSDNIKKFVLQLLAENVAQAVYLMVGLAFIDDQGMSVFPLSPVEVLWILVVTSCFPAIGLARQRAVPEILERPPSSAIFTKEVIIDMFVYGLCMATSCLVCFVVIVFGKGDGYLGQDCNASDSASCDLVFRARSASFATMTWCALILAWECVHPINSLFYMNQTTDRPWWKQTAIDLWDNQMLFWSVMFGFVTVFPVVYIPVINNKVFLHKGIGYEWGVAIGFTVLFLLCAECWKWTKRVYIRREHKKALSSNDILQSNDTFEKYASFSRANTMDNQRIV